VASEVGRRGMDKGDSRNLSGATDRVSRQDIKTLAQSVRRLPDPAHEC
jgi:hypothetical protein